MAPNTVDDDLDTSLIGAFQADKIDDVDLKKVKKMIPCVGIYSRGYSLPEQGTWHLDRKRAILRDHPEVRQLYGQNPLSILVCVVAVSLQLYYAYHFSHYSWLAVVLGSYIIGAWIAFVGAVVGHDSAHRLVSKSSSVNRLTTILAFLPVFNGPVGTVWMYEHMWHHNVVVDKSLRYGLQSNPIVKKAILALIFVLILNIITVITASALGLVMLVTIPLGLLGLRASKYPKKFSLPPYSRFPQSLNGWTFLNILICVAFNVSLCYVTGLKGFVYINLSSIFANGLHPLGMRQVQEHYFVKIGQPTYSVYPPLAFLTFNVGHHVEHHDFPNIPWSRLPLLRKIAHEYYDDTLYGYPSYTHVLFEFLFNKGIPLSALFDVDIETPQGILKPDKKKN